MSLESRERVRFHQRAEFVDRLAGVLDLADAALPFLTQRPVEAFGEVQAFLDRTKFVSETALLLYVAKRTGDGRELQGRIGHLAKTLSQHARSEGVVAWMRLRPDLISELTVAHFCLTLLGEPDPTFDAEVRALGSMTSLGLTERVPWKDLEEDWHRQLGTPVPMLNVEAAIARTAIAQTQNSLFATRQDVYAFTHGLIYATDFGHRPSYGPRPPKALTDDASSALSRCLDEDDFDLGAEVLLTWPYLRARWEPTAVFGFHVLLGVQDAVGFLPSMSLRYDSYIRLSEVERSRYFFAEGYHTVYVMGLLDAAVLLPGIQLPGAPPSDSSTAKIELAGSLYDLLLPAKNVPQWETYFKELDESQQASLTTFLADVGIRRAVKAADFGRLREVLSVFLAHDVEPSPAVQQGTELLSRVARGIA